MTENRSSPEGNPEGEAGESTSPDPDEIRREIERQHEAVPWIGEVRTRWYDYPYWLLDIFFVKRGWWPRLPSLIRRSVMRIDNWLLLFNEYDRDKISWPDNPIYNVIVPEDEHVRIPIIWVTELYSPAYVNGLTRAVKNRSWPRDQTGRIPGDELSNQLHRAREQDTGFYGPIGSFVSRDSKAWWIPDAKKERLPEGIEHIEVHVQAIGPALTAVVATFRLNADAQEKLDVTIKSDHPPRLVRANGRLHLYQKMFSGINDVQGERANLHNVARQWLASRIPGVFASEDVGQLPVLDMLLTRRYDPLSDVHDRDDENYLRALGLDRQRWNQIISPQLPGFELSEYHPERLRSDDRSQWALVARYEKAFSDGAFEYYGDSERSARNIANAADLPARALLTRLAISDLLDLKLRKLNQSRDIAAMIYSGLRPVKSIKMLRSQLLTGSVDLEAIAETLTRFTDSRNRYEYGVPILWLKPGAWQINHPGREPDTTNEHLLADWAKLQASKVKKLTNADRSLMELLNVTASLTSSLSQLRTQRWAIIVSIASLTAAVIAVWLAYLAIKHG